LIVVRAEGIYKVYKTSFLGSRQKEVLRNVSLSIKEGSIYGILGPNGAGKTTLISILSTLLLPDRGEIQIYGYDALREASRIKNMVNISSGNPNFPWSLTVRENLNYFAMLYGIPHRKRDLAVEEVIHLLELEPFEDTRFEALSTGIKQRVSLAKSLINEPKLLFLDEPTIGLDPDISIKIRKMIQTIHKEKNITIILTTHYMKEAEQLCDRIAFIRGGEIIADAPPEDLKRQTRIGESIIIRYLGYFDPLPLKSLEGVLEYNIYDDRIRILVEDADSILDQVIKLFSHASIKHIEIAQPNLEDVFLELAK